MIKGVLQNSLHFDYVNFPAAYGARKIGFVCFEGALFMQTFILSIILALVHLSPTYIYQRTYNMEI